MRNGKMITEGEMSWSFIKFSQLILQGMYGDQCVEIKSVCRYWNLKGQYRFHQGQITDYDWRGSPQRIESKMGS